MPWIKFADKHPPFDMLIELDTENGSRQAMFKSWTGEGATFLIYNTDETEEVLIKPGEDIYWQHKQPGTKPSDGGTEPGKQRAKRIWTPEQKKAAAERQQRKRDALKDAAKALTPAENH